MRPPRKKIVCAGEAMVELRREGAAWHVHYGGDTLNVALHLVRLGHNVAYLTALGLDPFANGMSAAWSKEGLDLNLVQTHPTRSTGLYAIETDVRGERHFSYWRSDSAARAMFECDGIDDAEEDARQADLLFFSLISLAILPESGRERMLRLAERVRANGGQVAFDSNYRPRLWESREVARIWHDRAVAQADFGFPTLDDERMIGVDDRPDEVARYWEGLGCREVVVKLGAEGCRLPDGQVVLPAVNLDPVDTSGAGDAFDAGYLGTRLRGASMEDAAHAGNGLAGWTLMHPGAIPAQSESAPYKAIASFEPELGG
ncbi:MAG TPA: sugar kinase [Sphingomonadaceae bacterium]|nr:sugar kinase [Sphingomonadaceae bacterium]